MPVSFAAQSHPGTCRVSNEDSYAARPDLGLFIVADGLGGHVAGHVASSLAAETFQAVIGGTLGLEERARLGPPVESADPILRLHAAFRLAFQRLVLQTTDDPRLRGMGTTVAAVLLAPDAGLQSTVHSATGLEWPAPDAPTGRAAVLAHLGDSRIYCLAEGRLQILTDDHSWVGEQVQAGTLTPEQARRHPWRNMVTRALTGEQEPEPEVRPVILTRGNRLLLCSDGLSSVLSDQELAAMLAGTPEGGLETVCDQLVMAANLAGGPDNITVIVLDI